MRPYNDQIASLERATFILLPALGDRDKSSISQYNDLDVARAHAAVHHATIQVYHVLAGEYGRCLMSGEQPRERILLLAQAIIAGAGKII